MERRIVLAAALFVTGLLAAGTVGAVGGDDGNPATKVDGVTQKCQASIGAAVGKYAYGATKVMTACLDAIVKCDEQGDATKALACRSSLLRPGAGKCAEGKVDEGLSLIGTGAASNAALAPSSKAAVTREMNKLTATLQKQCIASGAVLDDLATGLGYLPLPATAADLADAINADPGGLQCNVNANVRGSYPLADAIVGVVSPLHLTCIKAADPLDLGIACVADVDCGNGGVCGKLALVFREALGVIKTCN
jgi:hypothetical protein